MGAPATDVITGQVRAMRIVRDGWGVAQVALASGDAVTPVVGWMGCSTSARWRRLVRDLEVARSGAPLLVAASGVLPRGVTVEPLPAPPKPTAP